MPTYSEKNTLRIAKRFNNTKRSYLLVNPLQAKHIPVSPTESLQMMHSLGDLLFEKYPSTKLIIGFAETATAIGAAVSSRFSPECIYIHTTRENVTSVSDWIIFQEEHSHAVEQKLCSDSFGEWISKTDTIIFVEDEISTGKTLINMVSQLKNQFPSLAEKTLVAASILNRVSPENEQKLHNAGILCEYLVKLSDMDYTAAVDHIQVTEAPLVTTTKRTFSHHSLNCAPLKDSRIGNYIRHYEQNCEQVADAFLCYANNSLKCGSKILVLGTEECMFPALVLGKKLESANLDLSVFCHATTRSPIGITDIPNYPITNGVKLKSFYDDLRSTYLYNLASYDAVIVVSDTSIKDMEALENLITAMESFSTNFYYIQGGSNVWYI